MQWKWCRAMFETARIQENIKYSILKGTFGLCNHMGGTLLGEKIEYIITDCIIMQILVGGGGWVNISKGSCNSDILLLVLML